MRQKMLAAVYYGPRDLRVEHRPIPKIGSHEALLRVITAGICGTDIRILHGEHGKYPPGTIRIPGHEIFGEIAQVGHKVSDYCVGQRVFLAPNMGCGKCLQCISGSNNLCAKYNAPGITYDGSFAEYVRVPPAAVLQGNLIEIGSVLDPAVATLIEPFACVLRGQDALQIKPGENILLIGAGPIGVMHLMLARFRGAACIIVSELDSDRLAQAMHLGADRALNPAEEDLAAVVSEETKGAGVDVVIVAAPAHKAQETALELASIGGRINFFGGLPKDRPTITFNSNLVHYKELNVTGTAACSTNDCHRAAEIVCSGRIDLSQVITSRYPLHNANAAFAEAEAGKSLKVLIEP